MNQLCDTNQTTKEGMTSNGLARNALTHLNYFERLENNFGKAWNISKWKIIHNIRSKVRLKV